MQSVDERIEQSNLWRVFHKHLIVEMFDQLRDQLGDAYLVDLEGEISIVPVLGGVERTVSPDVSVAATELADYPANSAAVSPTVLEVDQAMIEYEQYAIAIRQAAATESERTPRLVCVVELLSPTNKGAYGDADRRKFLRKRNAYLTSDISYLEIDLLVNGVRDLPMAVDRLEAFRYFVWASQLRASTRRHWGWGWAQDEPVPVVLLPLDYPTVFQLDLRACYSAAYRRNRWPLRLEG